MKRIYCILLCISVLLSCEKKDRGEDINLSGHTIFNVNMEAIRLLDPLPYEKVWKEGDMIGVYGSEQGTNKGFFLKESSDGKTIAEFYGPLVKGDLIRAYFPYDESLTADINAIPFSVSQSQTYDAQLTPQQQFLKYATRSFAVLDENNELYFRYPYGMLEVRVSLNEQVNMSGATLRGSVPVSGMFALNEKFGVSQTDLSQNEIVLDFGGKVVPSLENGNPALLHFVLPPLTYSSGTLQLEVDMEGGQKMVVLLDDIVINRIEGTEFTITSVPVGLSGIPELEVENGYLEE